MIAVYISMFGPFPPNLWSFAPLLFGAHIFMELLHSLTIRNTVLPMHGKRHLRADSGHDGEGSHHVIIFVFKDVTVIDVGLRCCHTVR